MKFQAAIFCDLLVTLLLIVSLFEKGSSHKNRKSSKQQISTAMSRPKRPVNGRISVHTCDILDELLDDKDKHEIAKVKSSRCLNSACIVYLTGDKLVLVSRAITTF